MAEVSEVVDVVEHAAATTTPTDADADAETDADDCNDGLKQFLGDFLYMARYIHYENLYKSLFFFV